MSALGDRSVTSFSTIGNTLFVGTNGSGVFRSSDNGATWSAANVGLGTSLGITTLATNLTNVFTIASGKLFTSTDLGNSWIANSITPISVVITHQNLVYSISSGDVLRSMDNGSTWLNTSPSTFSRSATSIISDGSRLFVFSSQGVFISANNGDTWQSIVGSNNRTIVRPTLLGNDLFGIFFDGTAGISCGTSSLYVNRSTAGVWSLIAPAAVSPSNPTTLFALGNTNLFVGTCTTSGGGIFLSTNSGSTWASARNGLTTGITNINAFTWAQQVLFVGTSLGLFRSPLSITSGVSNEKSTADNMMQLYPNPASELVKISYSLQRRSRVQADVMNTLGQKIAEVFEGEQGEGEQTFSVATLAFPVGTYVLRLFVNGQPTIKLFQVLR